MLHECIRFWHYGQCTLTFFSKGMRLQNWRVERDLDILRSCVYVSWKLNAQAAHRSIWCEKEYQHSRVPDSWHGSPGLQTGYGTSLFSLKDQCGFPSYGLTRDASKQNQIYLFFRDCLFAFVIIISRLFQSRQCADQFKKLKFKAENVTKTAKIRSFRVKRIQNCAASRTPLGPRSAGF